MTRTIPAPFPWFGGKKRVADTVWRALGNPDNFVEPFAGSLAVLLARPHAPRTETVNDSDGLLINFWRAVKHDPEAVAAAADWPVSELDLSARHLRLVSRRADLTERMAADPSHFDVQLAGWWVWGACAWIGSGWCSGEGPWTEQDGLLRKLPHLGDRGRGIKRQMPHIGNRGQGINRQMPHLDRGQGITEWFGDLSERLRDVRITCGDWARVCEDSVTVRHGETAVFLDPPYFDGAVDYAEADRGVAVRVREWAQENGGRMRIALCGYDGDHDMPGWQCHKWKAHGGYSSADGENQNATRERVWLSPRCAPADAQGDLFGGDR